MVGTCSGGIAAASDHALVGPKPRSEPRQGHARRRGVGLEQGGDAGADDVGDSVDGVGCVDHEEALRLVRGEPPPGAEGTDVPSAYRVERVDDALLAEGRIWPQSRASQLAGLCVGSQEGERVLDLCAAPGGKTGQLRGEVTAVEIDPARARELRENLATMGRTDVTVVEADGTALPPDLAGFDHALVDAPCSGLGVLGQRPDLRWRATPLPELQLALLRSAAERVRPGGTVVYAVCTLNPDECEGIVDASGLGVLPLGEEWPAFAHPSRPEFLLTLPHVHRTSGFFVARLVRD